MNERQRGTMVHIINAKHIAASDAFRTNHGWDVVVPTQIRELVADFGYVAVATGRDGTDYVMCEEGVGWKTTEPLKGWMFGPCATANVPWRDLADVVRVFGARLESNFYTLRRALND